VSAQLDAGSAPSNLRVKSGLQASCQRPPQQSRAPRGLGGLVATARISKSPDKWASPDVVSPRRDSRSVRDG